MKYTPAAIDYLVAACSRADHRRRIESFNDYRYSRGRMKETDAQRYAADLEDGAK